MLADWIPRKIAASPEYLSAAPALLRAFIRFCHAERKIRPALTDETLAAVDEQEPEYQRVIRSPRPQGPMAMLAAMGMLGGQQPWEDEPSRAGQYLLDALAEEVGGQDALDSLDGTPLPDEGVRLGRGSRRRTRAGREVLAACDRCCDDLLGAEYRRRRRLLARAAPGLSSVLRKTAKPEVTALRAGDWQATSASAKGPANCGQDLMSYFSPASQASRARLPDCTRRVKPASTYPAVRLGSPSLLVSARRRRTPELRDRRSAATSGKRRA